MGEKKEQMTLNVIIEIPKGSQNKYEFDKKRNLIKFDRMLFSAVHYPSDYGFIPESLAQDYLKCGTRRDHMKTFFACPSGTPSGIASNLFKMFHLIS